MWKRLSLLSDSELSEMVEMIKEDEDGAMDGWYFWAVQMEYILSVHI
jgi:hypothetical protein